ncbi:MAG: hypothetical protein KGH55_01460 [Nanoarchaeota archaeon]|nr:hypothetical protein [Nanoarchaeota archaeon]
MQNKKRLPKILIVGAIIIASLLVIIAGFHFFTNRNKSSSNYQYSGNNSNYTDYSYGNYSAENSSQNNNGNYIPNMPSDVASCGNGNAVFSVSPIPLSSISYIEPLGHVNPPGHVFPINHLYLYLPLDSQRTALKTEVSSPGNITIFKIERFQYYTDSSRTTISRTDYTLSFAPCSDISGFFYHLTSLSDKILNSFTSPFDYCNNVTAGDEIFQSCGKYVDVKINAGENIGTAGGQPQGSQALDWVLEDFRIKPLEYANDSRFSESTGQDYSRYIVCPLDYFTGDLQNSLYGFLGGYAIDNPFTTISKRTAGPLCGTTAQDILGTAQGNWFVGGASPSMFSEEPNLALIHDDINTNIGIFSVGTSMSSSGLDGGAYYFTPSNSGLTDTDFSNVKPDGNVYCYQATEKLYSNIESAAPTVAIILQLVSPDELKIEKLNSGSCAAGPWSFSSSAQTFYR